MFYDVSNTDPSRGEEECTSIFVVLWFVLPSVLRREKGKYKRFHVFGVGPAILILLLTNLSQYEG
jgi:hypothetical protein